MRHVRNKEAAFGFRHFAMNEARYENLFVGADVD
jgi:hypothetical protein